MRKKKDKALPCGRGPVMGDSPACWLFRFWEWIKDGSDKKTPSLIVWFYERGRWSRQQLYEIHSNTYEWQMKLFLYFALSMVLWLDPINDIFCNLLIVKQFIKYRYTVILRIVKRFIFLDLRCFFLLRENFLLLSYFSSLFPFLFYFSSPAHSFSLLTFVFDSHNQSVTVVYQLYFLRCSII